MKKKILGAMSVVLVTSMLAASLTGCGSNAKATDQEVVMDEEPIIFTDKEDSEEATIETEEEITGTEDEVIGTEEVTADDGETNEEIDGDIIFYDEIEKYPEYMLSDMLYEVMEEKTVTATNDISVYSIEGIKVGYVKNGATVVLTEHGINTRWYRFENPVSGTDYDYLYVIDDDLPKEETPLLSAEEVKAAIIEEMTSHITYEPPTFLEAPTDDMEVYECRILREDVPVDFNFRFDRAFHDEETFEVGNYMTYYIECEEDGEFAICRLYYKDSRF